MASEFRKPAPLHGLSRGVLDPAVQHLAEENAALRREVARLRAALVGIQAMAEYDIGHLFLDAKSSLHQIEADARAALAPPREDAK